MKRVLLFVLAVSLGANCASHLSSQANTSAIQPTTQSAKTVTADSSEAPSPERENEVPSEFKGVDFKNFAYPSSFESGSVQLTDGSYEYPRPEGVGGDTFEFRGVDFVDMTGDGKKEAIVQIHWVSCGGSCDGGSHLFYVYSSKQNKPALFWRIESGSTAYGCGLKSLVVDGRKINLELFNECLFKGATPVSTPTEGEFGKFSALVYTRFLFESDRRRVALKKREVFPFTEGSAKNYSAEVSISND